MSGRRGAGPRSLRSQLAELEPALRPIAEDVLAEASRIDVVALDASGGVVAVFDAEGDDLACFTRALATSAWLTEHLPDWRQIAPGLGLDTALPVRAQRVATSCAPETRRACEQVGGVSVTVLTARLPQLVDTSATPLLPAADAAPQPATEAEPAPETRRPELRSHFRTGLRDSDLGLRDAAP